MSVPTTLSARVVKRRRELGLTSIQLDALADASGVINVIERGLSTRPRRPEAIARALGVSPCWLIFGVAAAPDPKDVELCMVTEALAHMTHEDRATVRELITTALGAQRREQANALLDGAA